MGSVVCVVDLERVIRFLQRAQGERAMVEAAFAFSHSSGTSVTKHSGVAHQHVEHAFDGGRYVNVILMLANGRGSRCPHGKDHAVVSGDAQYNWVSDDRYVLSHRITY